MRQFAPAGLTRAQAMRVIVCSLCGAMGGQRCRLLRSAQPEQTAAAPCTVVHGT